MLKIRLKKMIIPILVLLAVFAVWNYNKAPSSCVLCDNIPYHAPCLVNLSTGEVGELTVYEPHPFKVGELAEQQVGGCFSFISCAGLTGYCDTALWVVSIDVPCETDTMRKKHFCKSCREILSDYSGEGFVLADLYISGTPKIYPIHDGANYKIRCYTVSATRKWVSNKYTITVTGNRAA